MPTQAHEHYLANRLFGSLDGLRGVSVLGVVWTHAQRNFEGLPLLQRGLLGVDMFFVISGFLITTLLLRERERRGKISLRRFFARRSLRIFPLYYGILAVLSLLFWLVLPEARMAEPFFEELPWHATYTSNFMKGSTFLALTWSLAAEEQFYVAWAPLLKYLGTGALWVVAAVIGIGLAISFGLINPLLVALFGPHFRDLEILQATFNPIAFGVLVAWMLHGSRGFARVYRVLGSRGAAPLCALAVLALASLPVPDLWGWPRPTIQLAMAAMLAACVLREDHLLAPLLSNAVLRRVGVISYGIYLLHTFVMEIMVGFEIPWANTPSFPTFFLTLVLTWVVAEVSYRWFERPFLRLKTRFAA